MPRLHKYRNRDGSYVLTCIRSAVVTFQLTTDGERKLAAAGIFNGSQFNRAILLDLYRTGDAFTHGSGVDDPALAAAGQLEMDFANDPDPETAFPACDVCRSVNDLHLTLTGSPEDLVAQLQCATCRAVPAARPDTSIPVALLSRPILSRLFQMKLLAGSCAASCNRRTWPASTDRTTELATIITMCICPSCTSKVIPLAKR
jgi:hypothetical protein